MSLKHFLLAAILFLYANKMFAQYDNTIEARKQFGTYQFYADGQKLKLKEVANKLSTNAEAYKLFQSAKSNYVTGSVLGGVGGFLIGYGLGGYFFNKNQNTKFPGVLIGIGAGLALLTIPMNSAYNMQAKKAVDLYNSSHTSLFKKTFQLQVALNCQRAGVIIKL